MASFVSDEKRTLSRLAPSVQLAAALLALGFTLVFLVVLVNVGPSLIAAYFRAVVSTPEPSGGRWTVEDAETCRATAQAVLDWPGKDAPLVSQGRSSRW